MKRNWRRGGDPLDRRLRSARPQPPPALLEEIERSIRAESRSRRILPRAGVAVALTAILLAAVGATGGIGYAAGGARDFAAAAKRIVDPGSAADVSASPAASPSERWFPRSNRRGRPPGNNQYAPPDRVTICHRTPSGVGHTLILPRPAAEAHLRNHPQDTPGPCPSRRP